MADVRSLLRQERASRQQAARPQRQSAAPAAAPISRKRKAADEVTEERKRTRTEIDSGVPAGFFDGGVAEPGPQDGQASTAQEDLSQPETVNTPSSVQPTEPAVPSAPQPVAGDPDELDAFLKEMDEAPARPNVLPAFTGAVVEAAPMTAAEIAAQAREEQSAQRGRKEEELEAEKEDAARALQDEFEEMDGLEERVRKLREQREAVRSAAKMGNVTAPSPQGAANEEADSESDDEDEDWDDWRFRPA